ncbi:DUF6624 domain-containing protein [Pseudoxanthomonas sp. J31]|uniref:DUF6624 domain-containing protein n=1 Tax=Pseudoxanthomonas sp. J31 TaxID=935851 RepID=UPI00040BBA1A|nr:DUF6624 domain-containing protein [Pseudoxanthomonas sp. J31]
MRRLLLCTMLGLAIAGPAMADDPAAPADNPRLAAIYAADQAARSRDDIDWDIQREQDRAHRAEVLALLRAGQLRTATDYFRAGILFQRGESDDDYRTALALAQVSATLDPQRSAARWLTAAAWDRLLLHRGQPQWYGTQYQAGKDGALELSPVDEDAVDDAERLRMGVPTLAGARARAAAMGGD